MSTYPWESVGGLLDGMQSQQQAQFDRFNQEMAQRQQGLLLGQLQGIGAGIALPPPGQGLLAAVESPKIEKSESVIDYLQRKTDEWLSGIKLP